MKKQLIYLLLLLLTVFTAQTATAQAPVATPEAAITGLLNRIGGNGAADKFEIVIDANLAQDGKDVFIITSQNGKPCIKGNTQLSVATGINWYLNHYAHINLTWNNLTTDLVNATLPVPRSEEKHVCNTTYRYDFNTCTFSYSMAFWTWERWQQEIDWMALHGINAPLNLVGLDVVTRNFLKELGMSDSDIAAYIAGPGFIAWFAMNNLEGWGGTIESQGTGVFMQGNPDWWYTRQEQLCRNMLQRMRELGMHPVIPGFSGQIPNSLSNYTIKGFSSSDVINGGTWAGGYTRPDILHPNSSSYATLAPIYYKHLEAVMGVSEFYSMDPFHEGGLPGSVTNATCYPPIMAALDTYHNAVNDATKTSYKVSTEDNQAKWIIQYWQNIPQSGAFSSMSSYGDRFIGLDLFSDNIYAGNAAKWRDTGNACYYQGRPYIYCMLHNFGGRSGLHGRLETTMDGYFQALAKGNNCQGIGATPEGIETNPILYDMLFELPWMSANPGADNWLKEYAYSRYGINPDVKENVNALEALKNLKKSVWNCQSNQQGTSEAVILARPNWTIGSVSSWSTSAIYWDTQDVLLAADQLYSVKDLVTANGGQDGIANYNYDFIDVVRQAMVDYAAQLLPLINAARGNDAEYTRLYQLYLQLMLDLDEMLSYDENFKLERWTSLARNIAGEVSGTTENDRNWLEWNARTQITVWSKGNTDLHDYSNRCWAGLIKDFHYKRWEKFFTTKGGSFDGGWYSGFEYPWTVDFNGTYNLAGDYSKVVIPTDMTATEKAAQTFGNYFGRVKGAAKNYIFPMGVTTNATKSDVIPEVYRGQEVELPLIIGKNVTITEVKIDLNGDSSFGNGETLTANGNKVTIPADAKIGVTTAQVTYSDGTVIKFRMALIEDITDARTVTAVAGANGSVAIEGTNELTITNMEAVKITATANTGYNFKEWTDAQGNVVGNDNPFIYYGKDAATFTANFIQDKWGVVACSGTFSGDIASYAQFIHNLTFAYYNREAETIFETTTAPTEIFNTIPQIVNVPQGASFDVKYDNGNSDGLKYCYFRAFIDLNQDGDFDDEGELLKAVGTDGAANTAVCSNKINVLLPYDMPLGITHMRLRFDGAWDNGNKPSGRGAKDASIRPVYEIIINVTEGSDKAAHIEVETNSADWGTVECWTDETPGWTAAQEWDVSANIPMHIKAIPASADVEFVGWYDQYGRLLTTDLEYSRLAIENAVYTARFRKFLEIDGWQIEYRTQPGSEVVTNKLANGVKPEAGKKYYIYADTYYNGAYVNRYLYNNNGTLSLNTSVGDANYMWLCSVDGENYTFQNVADPTKYLKHKGIQDSPYNFKLGTGTISHEGITIYSVNDSRYLVTKNDGSVFDQATGTFNQSNGDWNTDYVFTEVSTPDVVILTKVRKSGNHDLVIPETVEILGQQCKIVGFDNNLFKDNKDLWTISLPATIEEMSNNKVFTGVVKGKGANASADASNYITTDLGTTLAAGEDWSISLTITDNGNNFNQWGSALIATGNAPMNSTYGKGFQLYLQAGGGLVVKTDVDGDGNKLTNLTKGTKFRIDVVYTHSNTTLKVTATPLTSASASAARAGVARAAAASLEVVQDMSDFSVVSHAIPEGVNITNLEVRKGAEPDPFEGCTNLLGVTVDAANENYIVEGRTLKSTGGTTLHTLADEEKEKEIRALGELIDLTKALIAEVATNINPTGKETALTLTTTQGSSFYVSTNADQNTGGGNSDGGGIAALVDNNEGTYFHSRWSGTDVNATHHIQVDLGDGNSLSDFKFSYVSANGPDPTKIVVKGSNNGEQFDQIGDIIIKDAINSGATYVSGIIEAEQPYSYLRFEVTESYRWNANATPQGEYCFSMKEFDIYDLTSTAEVAPKYANLAGVEAGDVERVYDSLAKALYYYNNGGTADKLDAARAALEPLYTALKAKKDKVFNGVYNIVYNNKPVFIAYSEPALTGVNGYELYDATTENGNPTSSEFVDAQAKAINGMKPADALIIIAPNGESTGYTLSVQGLYMKTTKPGDWASQSFDSNEEQAGVYLFEEVETGVYKLKSNAQSIQYVYDWGHVFGNNEVSEGVVSTYEIVPVTEYTLNVPEGGATTLCLPFNVVLPEGVTAYDLAKANITTTGKYSLYELVEVAGEGDVLAKNTPVIIKADAKDYTLAITMDGEGANGSVENSVLRSAIVKSTVAAGNNYTFDGENFNRVATDTEIAANQCWMELDENVEDVIYNEVPQTVFNGVYNINFDGGQLFIAYAEKDALYDLTGYGNAGFRLFDAKVNNDHHGDGNNSGDTAEAHKKLQQDAIDDKAVADALFTIVPSGDGYKISAQGQYMRATGVYSQWSIQAFDTDANNAGIYLFEETEVADVFKLKSTINIFLNDAVTNYVNDWGPVFGNDLSSKPNLSTFTLTPVTEYTLAVPANGVTTLCLPFNVVLPAGVTAYDLANANITKANRYSTYELVPVAGEGDVLAKNTPVIIKATEGDHILTITMDGEDVKGSVENSLLRSGIVKTTLADGNNYTFDGKNFNRVAAGTVISANQCWMQLDENLGDMIYGEAPAFVLTTDEANPVLYKIISKRGEGNAKVLSYDEPTSEKVKIVDNTANSSYQAWYFMQGENGILIKPFNADGRMLTIESTGDGAGKAIIAAENDDWFQEWSITKSTQSGCTDYYYIKVVGEGNAGTFSHNGGFDVTSYMGVWASGFNSNDPGSLFKFVDAEFENDNARFYQLNDYLPAMNQGIFVGESIGLYSEDGVNDLQAKYTEALSVINKGSDKSSSDDCYAMYKALRAAKKDAYNAPDANKVYYIVSTSTQDYCKGKYVHTYSEPRVHQNATWGDNIYDQNHLLFDAAEDISNLSLAAFSLEETGTQGEYKMKNLHTGLYVKSFAKDATHMAAEAAVVKIAGVANGQVTLKIGTEDPMHAQEDYGVIVQWDCEGGNANTASSWTINEVPQGDLNKIYKLIVPESGVAALNLAFNVVLPQGVTAYDFVEGDIAQAEDGNSYEFNLSQVAAEDEVLAKNTPVIIRAAAGEYNLQVIFSNDNVKSGTEGSVLRGNNWQTTVGTDDAVNYLPAVVDNRFVFNKVTDATVVPANTVWAVLSSADMGETIYEFVPEHEAPKVEIVAGKVYRIKNYTVNTPDQYKEHYLANSNASIVFPTEVEADDKSAMWVCTSADEENHKYKFVSALGTASFGWQGAAEEAFEYTIAAGTIDGTVTLINNNMSLALTTEAWKNQGYAAFNKATVVQGSNGMVQAEYWSTDWYLEEVETPNVSFTASIRKDNMWATMYLPYAVTIPQGVEVYYAAGIEDNKINLTSFVQTIPARTAVLLRRAGETPSTNATADFKFAIAEDVAAVETVDEGDNLFEGTIMQTAIAAPEGTRVYLLSNYNDTEKFYWMAAEYDVNCKLSNVGGYVKNDANKAYLKIENAKSASLGFRFDGATDIEDVDGENGEVKAIYDLQGRKLSEITKPGFYIVDGKKVFIK